MSGALLALAMALLILPAGSRRRIEALGLLARVHRRSPLLPSVGVLAVVMGFVLPAGVVAACAITGATVWTRRRRRIKASGRAAESAALQGALDVLVGELRV